MRNVAMTYVGAEPDGMHALGAALHEASAAAGNAGRRLAALLEQAEECSTDTALPDLSVELGAARREVRRRARIAEDFVATMAVEQCRLPWHDPLRRAVLAVGANAANVGRGFVEGLTSSAVALWELRPFHDGSHQAWVSLSAGVKQFWQHPGEGFLILVGAQELEERGFSYALGAAAPGVIATVLGGSGVALRGARVVSAADHIADAGSWAGRLSAWGRTGPSSGPAGRRPPAGPRPGARGRGRRGVAGPRKAAAPQRR